MAWKRTVLSQKAERLSKTVSLWNLLPWWKLWFLLTWEVIFQQPPHWISERDPLAGNMSLRSQVSGTSLSGKFTNGRKCLVCDTIAETLLWIVSYFVFSHRTSPSTSIVKQQKEQSSRSQISKGWRWPGDVLNSLNVRAVKKSIVTHEQLYEACWPLSSFQSSSSLKSDASSFAAVDELEEDFLGTPLALVEETVKRR